MPLSASPTRPLTPSRTERSAETQARLLQATIACLIDRGYSGLAVAEVCERARVSRGAQLHHFPTRLALVAAALDFLYARLRHDFLEAFTRASDAADPARSLVEHLWAQFSRPELKAVIELWLAAQNEPALHARVIPVMLEFSGSVAGWAAELFPEAAVTHPDFPGVMRLVFKIMQGAALGHIAFSPYEEAMVPEDLDKCARLIRSVLEPPAPERR